MAIEKQQNVEHNGTFSIFWIIDATNIFTKRGSVIYIVVMPVQQMSNLLPNISVNGTSVEQMVNVLRVFFT